ASNDPLWLAPTIAALPLSAATVSTDQTQSAGAAYGDLSTTGPAVTLTLAGTSATVWISSIAYLTAASAQTCWISVAVSGSTTVAASDTNSADFSTNGSSFNFTFGRVLILTGLTSGSNTFTMKYKNSAGSTW